MLDTKKNATIFLRDAKMLVETFSTCSDDMHEPDESGWDEKPVLRGGRMDNACGTQSNKGLLQSLDAGCAEAHLQMKNQDGPELLINLANLIALARIGAEAVIRKNKMAA